jgi:hypothetical protein
MRDKKPRDLLTAGIQTLITTNDFRTVDASHVEMTRASLIASSSQRIEHDKLKKKKGARTSRRRGSTWLGRRQFASGIFTLIGTNNAPVSGKVGESE